jgi:aspartate/methionine/tyrosine aminotransferase
MCRWLAAQVEGLAGNRAALIDALSPLGSSSIVGGEGAIYLFAKLPDGEYRALS